PEKLDITVSVCSYCSDHARGANKARSRLACQAGFVPSIPCAARSQQYRKRQMPGGVSRSPGQFAECMQIAPSGGARVSQQASLVLDARSRLPRGRHGIPQEVIAANQRLRLMSATAAVIVEQGYASLAVGDVIDRAGVSRATFYKLFKDKHDCVLASQRWAFDCLRDTIAD